MRLTNCQLHGIWHGVCNDVKCAKEQMPEHNGKSFNLLKIIN